MKRIQFGYGPYAFSASLPKEGNAFVRHKMSQRLKGFQGCHPILRIQRYFCFEVSLFLITARFSFGA
jgi:hypothetical protein